MLGLVMKWRLVAGIVLALVASRGAQSADDLTALNNQVELLYSTGKYAEAVPVATRALAMAEQQLGPHHAQVAVNLDNLAELYRVQGLYADAEPLYKRALAIRDKTFGPKHPHVATSLNRLAGVYYAQARYGEAEPLYKRALAIREEALGSGHALVADSLNNIAVIYRAEGRVSEAEPLLKRALSIAEKTFGPQHPRVGTFLNSLAAVYESLHRYADAEPLYRRSVAILEQTLGPNHPDVGTPLNNLAAIYEIEGRYKEAEAAHQRTLALFEAALGPDHPSVSASLNNLAVLHFVQQDWARAVDYWRRSTAAIVRRVQRGTETAGASPAESAKLESERWSFQFWGLVKAAHRLADADPATASLLSAEMFEKAQWSFASQAARSLSQMALRGAKADPAIGALVRERQDLVAEWLTKDKQVIAARAASPDERKPEAEAELTARLAAIDARIGEIDMAFANRFPEYASLATPAPSSITDVQSQLRPDEALVLFFDTPEAKPTPEETFIWAVTKTQSRWIRIELGPKALAERVQALRCGLDYLGEWRGEKAGRCLALLKPSVAPTGASTLPFDLARANELYGALFGKIEDLIKDKRLLVVPSGALTVLPFHVLVTAKPAVAIPSDPAGYVNVGWLAERQAITVLPSVASLKALRQARKSAASRPYIGFGDPLLTGRDGQDRRAWSHQKCSSAAQETAALETLNTGIVQTIASFFTRGVANLEALRRQPPLPETTDELCAVARSLGADDKSVHLGEQATERSLKALSADGTLGNSRVVHFATHGLLAGETESLIKVQAEPALIFTPPPVASDVDDGLLTASEVTELKLDADWVIMSACNTAAGDKLGAEALSGLARAFFYAGARALLVSHWYVSSNAAVSLTTGAFEAMRQDPSIDRSEALRRSMLALMRSGGRMAHPANWAPFVLVGEGSGQ
jgi:CHAT domain-containing protein/tetratricopeptide (TPR) repeat protein